MAKRNGKRRAWTSEHVRTLKALAQKGRLLERLLGR